MSVYNSSVGSYQDDSDITIINPSIIHEHNDENVKNTYVPIITRLKQANNSSENRQITTSNNNRSSSSDGGNDYVIVDHNPEKNAKQLEEVLTFYIRDLKQETNTDDYCDQQLITRLMDLIRPVYRDNQQKMIQLDKVMEEISSLHDKRCVEKKEQTEQLRTEICQLNKMLFTARNESSIYNDENRNYSLSNTAPREHSINDYDRWVEIEDDAKKLHELVQSQKNQINEIVTLVSQTATAPNSLAQTNVSLNEADDTIAEKQTTSTPNTNIISTLLKKIQDITGQQQQQTVTTATPQEITLENYSPGISPTQSLATLTLESFAPAANNRTQSIEEPQDNQTPHTPIDIPLTPTPQNDPKKCPVCNHEFAATSGDEEMYDHIEKCLFPSSPQPRQPRDYECPNCNQKFSDVDEPVYHQHLSDCFNRDI